MIYGYIRTSRAAVDGLAGMHPETQVQALADAGLEPVNIVSDVGISGSVPVGERPGVDRTGRRACSAAIPSPSPPWTGSAAIGLTWWRSWNPCTAAGWASPPWPPPSPGFTPSAPTPPRSSKMMGEIILRVMAWAAQAELESIKRRIEAGVRRAAEEGRFPGRPRALTPDQTAAIRLLRRNGQSQSAVARTFGVSRQTVWCAEQTE